MGTREFIEFYYGTYDSDRKSLASLYRDESLLTFESASILGTNSIIEKLESLPFKKVKHEVSTFDAQPLANYCIMILVIGQFFADDEERPMNYTQAFQLMRDKNGQYFISNDIFKFVLC
ncbi:nuclear transport factor, putative [Talaromyces stipitatus ATCC 10500]|uniref:Nuclear transport factor 2 n=1 Tax=Talaromyces stipitatus (strain ATCC 10500 / CBS 375.48 / QM 6759 / NRRL 1006) TaxID=441959 RepID=B8LZ43_TALSN|nr:nuclear transport factor, putative [Talaromyces stipitatus ATCC 10500]EED21087.1 nuclear transport factor, putative [Talaromyces stipitatus ATCC 10500]